jgi:hypothetical protein
MPTIGLLIVPFGDGKGGNAQLGGGAGGGPLTSMGMLFLFAKYCELTSPFILWARGDFREVAAADTNPLLSVSLDAADGDGRLGDGRLGEMIRDDLADFAMSAGESVAGELDVG